MMEAWADYLDGLRAAQDERKSAEQTRANAASACLHDNRPASNPSVNSANRSRFFLKERSLPSAAPSLPPSDSRRALRSGARATQTKVTSIRDP